MPSRWFSASLPATPSSRNGTSATLVLLRQRPDRPGGTPRVVAAEVRRRFHAREDDRDAARLRALDDLRQVASQLVERQAAQRVVAAERDDRAPARRLRAPSRAGSARRPTCRLRRRRSRLRSPSLRRSSAAAGAPDTPRRGRQTQAGGEAVAERHDARPAVAGAAAGGRVRGAGCRALARSSPRDDSQARRSASAAANRSDASMHGASAADAVMAIGRGSPRLTSSA